MTFNSPLLEKEMTTHSSILAWEIPWKEEPGRLQAVGSETAGHDLATKQQNIPLYRLIPSLILWLYLMNKYEINAFIDHLLCIRHCLRLWGTSQMKTPRSWSWPSRGKEIYNRAVLCWGHHHLHQASIFRYLCWFHIWEQELCVRKTWAFLHMMCFS